MYFTHWDFFGRLKEAAMERNATQTNPRRRRPADVYPLSKNLSTSDPDSPIALFRSFVTAKPTAAPVAST